MLPDSRAEGSLTGGIQVNRRLSGESVTPPNCAPSGTSAASDRAQTAEPPFAAVGYADLLATGIKPGILKLGGVGGEPAGAGFQPHLFSHPLSADGFTLSSDAKIRQFWMRSLQTDRRVSAYFGEQLGTPSVMNIWIPDGMKDITVDRLTPRQRLLEALDEVVARNSTRRAHHIDAVEQAVVWHRREAAPSAQ